MEEWISVTDRIPLAGQKVILLGPAHRMRWLPTSDVGVIASNMNIECDPERRSECRYSDDLNDLYFLIDGYGVAWKRLPEFGITHWKLNPRYWRANAEIAAQVSPKKVSKPERETLPQKRVYRWTPEGRARRIAAVQAAFERRRKAHG